MVRARSRGTSKPKLARESSGRGFEDLQPVENDLHSCALIQAHQARHLERDDPALEASQFLRGKSGPPPPLDFPVEAVRFPEDDAAPDLQRETINLPDVGVFVALLLDEQWHHDGVVKAVAGEDDGGMGDRLVEINGRRQRFWVTAAQALRVLHHWHGPRPPASWQSSAFLRKSTESGVKVHLELDHGELTIYTEAPTSRDEKPALHARLNMPWLHLKGLDVTLRPFHTCNEVLTLSFDSVVHSNAFASRLEDQAAYCTTIAALCPQHTLEGTSFDVPLDQRLDAHAEVQEAPYPQIDMGEYVFRNYTNKFWAVNTSFPGLRLVSERPFVFIADKLLSQRQCEALISKARGHMHPSKVKQNSVFGEHTIRTSSEIRLGYSETSDIEHIFSQVLGMLPSHFEPVKIIRYEKGQRFGAHVDAMNACVRGVPLDRSSLKATHYPNRVVSVILYLNTVAQGGETKFGVAKNIHGGKGLKIHPRQGSAAIHFPAMMPAFGGEVDRCSVHAGMEAEEEKWVLGLWGWPVPLHRKKALKFYGCPEVPDS